MLVSAIPNQACCESDLILVKNVIKISTHKILGMHLNLLKCMVQNKSCTRDNVRLTKSNDLKDR